MRRQLPALLRSPGNGRLLRVCWETDMKRVVLALACLGSASCAMPNLIPPPAGSEASASAAAASSSPSACPVRTETLYVPQMPEPGFVPAPPRGATLVTPRRLQAAEPAWSSASVRCREEGKVTITYCVTANGAVENVLVMISS